MGKGPIKIKGKIFGLPVTGKKSKCGFHIHENNLTDDTDDVSRTDDVSLRKNIIWVDVFINWEEKKKGCFKYMGI